MPDQTGKAGALTYERVGEFFDGGRYLPSHLDKGSGDWLCLKGLTLAEDYFEGRLSIAFILAGTNVAAICSPFGSRSFEFLDEPHPRAENEIDVGSTLNGGMHLCHFERRQTGGSAHGDDEFMLVRNIQGVQAAEPLIPAVIRFKRLDFSDDLFAGELCFSILHGGHKSVLPFGEGELDAIRLNGPVSDHPKHEDIEGASKIMDGISNCQGDTVWQGHYLFDEVGNLVGVRLAKGHLAIRALAQIGVNLPTKVIDVVLCPRDL